MPTNLRMLRIQAKLDELFENKIDLSDASSQSESTTKFYTRAIAALAIVMKCGIDCETAAKHITDGYHDAGIDAIYNDTSQKKLFLVQSKWRIEGTNGVSQEEASTFVSGIKRMINLDFNGCNSRIVAKQAEIAAAIRDMDYQIELIYCHTGNQSMASYALRPIEELLHLVNEDETVELMHFDECKQQDIYEYLANGLSESNIVLDDVLLSDWGVVSNPYKAYYGTVPASAVGEWFCQHGNRLFNKNIRYYKGSTDVNLGIKEVLKETPDMFFYYNNGIKLLCKKITRKIIHSTTRETGLFALEGVSLVNGAQTTGVIGAVFAESPDSLTNARVFVQMIDLGSVEDDQATLITKLSNTQNRIDGKDFASLDPQQDRLRMELSLAGYQYLYKSGAKVDDPAHQISLDETIVAQACSLDDLSIVALAKRNVGALTENIDKTPYKLLFNGSTNSFSMFNGVQVLRAVDRYQKQYEQEITGRKRLVLVHGNRFLLHLVLKQIKHTGNYTTSYYAAPEDISGIETLYLDSLDKVYQIMTELFPEAYPANIFKNVTRLRQMAEKLDNVSD